MLCTTQFEALYSLAINNVNKLKNRHAWPFIWPVFPILINIEGNIIDM